MLRFAFKPRHPVTRVAFTADGSEVVTAQPYTGIAVRDRLTGVARVTHPLMLATIHELTVHSADGRIRVLTDPATFIFHPQPLPATVIPRHVSGNVEISTTAGSVRLVSWQPERSSRFWIWDFALPGETHLVSFRMHGPMHTDGQIFAVSPDTTSAICLRPQTCPFLASLKTGELVAELTSPIRLRHMPIGCVIIFSPDGSKLALGNGVSLSVFDLSGVPREMLEGGKRKVVQPLFTLERPDPTQHGTFADKQAEHWLPPVAFDHAGRTMLTLGLRNRVQRIDLATGGVMAEWGWRCEPIRSLAVSPDGLTAAAGCQRGELVLWDLE